MKLLVLSLSGLMMLAGAALIMLPGAFIRALREHQNSRVLYVLAVVVRALFGAALLAVAPGSLFPKTLAALGWLAIGAAVVIAAMGPRRFALLMAAVLSVPVAWGRAAGVVVVLLGGFLVYAVR